MRPSPPGRLYQQITHGASRTPLARLGIVQLQLATQASEYLPLHRRIVLGLMALRELVDFVGRLRRVRARGVTRM